ncbi:hypothetical protein [Haladaptatus sp. W1]|uniref:hypothetical protein n=1 Tax=Haladaptatus sp. W1 TaxID=1897478 RepID=UPI0020C7F4A0|nr:hypothetical protein [Haladaptatus sp. W1]
MSRVRDLTPDDARELTDLYEEYEWWEDREVDGVRNALSETEVAVGIEFEAPGKPRDGDLVAAARVLTDYTYYANVFDVIVATDPPRRRVR